MDGNERTVMTYRVGVIGGGQLARMMIAPAVELGVEIRVLAEQEGMAAALAATAVGDYRDADTVLAFAREVDVIASRTSLKPACTPSSMPGSPCAPGPTRCGSRRTS